MRSLNLVLSILLGACASNPVPPAEGPETYAECEARHFEWCADNGYLDTCPWVESDCLPDGWEARNGCEVERINDWRQCDESGCVRPDYACDETGEGVYVCPDTGETCDVIRVYRGDGVLISAPDPICPGAVEAQKLCDPNFAG